MNRLEMVTDNLEKVIGEIKKSTHVRTVSVRSYIPRPHGIDPDKLNSMQEVVRKWRDGAKLPPVLLIGKYTNDGSAVYESKTGAHRWLAHFGVRHLIDAVVLEEYLWNKFQVRLNDYEDEYLNLERSERPEKTRSDYYREVIAWIEEQK